MAAPSALGRTALALAATALLLLALAPHPTAGRQLQQPSSLLGELQAEVSGYPPPPPPPPAATANDTTAQPPAAAPGPEAALLAPAAEAPAAEAPQQEEDDETTGRRAAAPLLAGGALVTRRRTRPGLGIIRRYGRRGLMDGMGSAGKWRGKCLAVRNGRLAAFDSQPPISRLLPALQIPTTDATCCSSPPPPSPGSPALPQTPCRLRSGCAPRGWALSPRSSCLRLSPTARRRLRALRQRLPLLPKLS